MTMDKQNPASNTRARKKKKKKKKKSKSAKRRSLYEPLPEGGYIRILVVQPGNYDDEIICHLEVQSLGSAQKYSAISYVWGNPNNTVDIRCQNLTVPITVNLSNALRRFRSPQKSKRLWADALCINQSDDEEKGHQVTHMGRVYENATCVLIWLGLDLDEVAKDCFRLIEDVNKYFEQQYEEYGRNVLLIPELKAPYPIPMRRTDWLTLATLAEMEWFRRVWTLQECALAHRCRMFWGSASIDFADVVELSASSRTHMSLDRIIRRFTSSDFSLPVMLFQNAYCYFRQVPTWHCSRPALQYFFKRFQSACLSRILSSNLRATDKRDYVYAFLSCRYAKDDDGQPLLEANYAASVEEVYYNVAKALLGSSREGPWVLSAVTRSTRTRIDELPHPSWVPQWSLPVNMMADPEYLFKAGGPLDCFTPKITGKVHLSVSGFVFDTVIWTTININGPSFLLQPESKGTSADGKNELFIDRLWRVVVSAAQEYGLEICYEDFTRTLLLNHCGYFHARHQRLVQAYRKVASLSQSLASETVASEIEIRDATFISQRWEEGASGRCLFFTRTGKLGLGTYGAIQKGDSCCIIMGTMVPFLLAPGTGSRYRLVEECYIHGVMEGELLDQFEPTTIVIE